MINCIVIDDEPHNIELLTLHIEQIPYLNLVGTAADPITALQLLNNTEVNLLFLDIQMPGLTGLEFLKMLNERYKVILTTAYREYALEGFDLNVVDYLLKPIFFPRFLLAVERAQQQLSIDAKQEEEFIFVKTEYKGKLVKIKLNEIVYIEAKAKYVCFYTADNKNIMVQLNISALNNILLPDRFVRIHKSFIIAIPFIVMINGNMVQLEHYKNAVPIGQTYRDSFMSRMTKKVLNNMVKDPLNSAISKD